MTTVDIRNIQMREILLQNISEKYQSLTEAINKIQMIENYKINAINNINTGFLWAKEGIGTVIFNFDEKKSEETIPVIEEKVDNN